MTLDRWDDTAEITYDRNIWNELCSLRFVESGHNALILGPVGVGQTFLDTADIYELIVERHRTTATVVTSNRTPVEWLGLMADPLLAQSAIDRLQSAAHELVLDGESYRQRQRPGITDPLDQPTPATRTSRRRR